MAAYMIARISVSNPEEYMKYASQTVALAEKFGGRFLAKGGPYKQLEGSGPDRHVIVKFPDMDTAERWYNSPEYQAIAPIRQANSTGDLVIVEGI